MGAPMAKKDDNKSNVERDEDPHQLIMNKPMDTKKDKRRKPTRRVMVGDAFVNKDDEEDEGEKTQNNNKQE